MQLVIFITSILIATFMYYFIEQPFRDKSQFFSITQKTKIRLYFLVTLLLTTVSFIVWQSGGWHWRFVEKQTIDNISVEKNKRYSRTGKGCFLSDYYTGENCELNKVSQVLIIGNSHEVDGYNIMHSAYESSKINFIQYGTTNNCSPLGNSKTLPSDLINSCHKSLQLLDDETFIKNLNAVIYSSNQPFAINKMDIYRLISQLKTINPSLQLIIIGGYINNRQPCSELIFKYNSSSECKNEQWVRYFPPKNDDHEMIQQFDKLDYFYIDKVKILCRNSLLENCKTETNDGIPFSYDGSHLSLEFAELIGSELKQVYPELMLILTSKTNNKNSH